MNLAQGHASAPPQFPRDEERNQILRTVLMLGGLPGGETDTGAFWRRDPEFETAATAKLTTVEGAARLIRVFETALTAGDTVRSQHECDPGIADGPHMSAIFKQQACSSGVIACPGRAQAASGWPKSISASSHEPSFAVIRTMSILPCHATRPQNGAAETGFWTAAHIE
jgi:hypothetical protein